jgi:hypothetical protein
MAGHRVGGDSGGECRRRKRRIKGLGSRGSLSRKGLMNSEFKRSQDM